MSSGKRQRSKARNLTFDSMVSYLRSTMADFPDKRTGTNTRYSIGWGVRLSLLSLLGRESSKVKGGRCKDGGQRTEDGGRKTEGKGRTTDDGGRCCMNGVRLRLLSLFVSRSVGDGDG